MSFFSNDPPTTAIYTLSLHDALPIYEPDCFRQGLLFGQLITFRSWRARIFALVLFFLDANDVGGTLVTGQKRSEEHTSELQSHLNLVCRLLLEKKKKKRIYIYHLLLE